MATCNSCRKEAGDGRFCPACGVEQFRPGRSDGDALLGQRIAGRYEILELIDAGGGGRVYRAVQKPLERVIAIKMIHPTLLTSDEAVTRFMDEARTLSRLNHPNVVSVYDFGWSSPGESSQLFLVMEYVTGPNLASLLGKKEPVPLRRVASIIGQVLGALSEAHHQGITHRDVKPENIMLQPTRGGTDHVKVIDFGIAQSARRQRVTEFGKAVGTPEYMAPEQVRGEGIGPAADLYSLGVVLFEALTGRLPFQGGTGVETMVRQLAAPRPDPRTVAPERQISPELAAVCMRALSVDPADRFPDAAAFAEALEQALPPEAQGTRGLVSACSRNSAPPVAVSNPSLPRVRAVPKGLNDWIRTPIVEFGEATEQSLGDAGIELDPVIFELPFTGRSTELDWALEQLVRDSGACVALCGRSGVGKTRLLRELCAAAGSLDMTITVVTTDPMPHCQVGYSALRRMIIALSGLSGTELACGEGVPDSKTAQALRALFSVRTPGARSAEYSASAALEWSAQLAVARARGGSAVLVVDDADRADGSSLAALAELMKKRSVRGFSALITGERLPNAMIAAGVSLRGLEGLTPAQALELLGDGGFKRPLARRDDVEPLYVEALLRWHLHDARPFAENLRDVVAGQIRKLAVEERRALLAVSVLGSGSAHEIEELLGKGAGTDPLTALSDSGLVLRREGAFELSHPLYGRILNELVPAKALAELHARAADRLGNSAGELELHAFHAVKGRPDVEAFMLLEEVARVRRQRQDNEGVAAALRLGLDAAHTALGTDEPSAAKPVAVFGRKLGGVLVDLGRLDEAHTVLSEALALSGLRELDRALLLEQLATVETARGRAQEAERLRGACLEAAERCGDSDIIARVTNSSNVPRRVRPTASARSPFSASGGYQIRIAEATPVKGRQ